MQDILTTRKKNSRRHFTHHLTYNVFMNSWQYMCIRMNTKEQWLVPAVVTSRLSVQFIGLKKDQDR
jgi:hypothetical protein